MDIFKREATIDNPEVLFDKNQGKFIISGKSLAENPVSFYLPVIEWFDNYIKNPNPTTTFEFKFDYFNSTSARIIANLLGKLEILRKTGHQVEVKWYFKENDKDMLDAGHRFSEIFSITFHYIPY